MPLSKRILLVLLACAVALALSGCSGEGGEGGGHGGDATGEPGHGQSAEETASHGETAGHGEAAGHGETAAPTEEGHGQAEGHGSTDIHGSSSHGEEGAAPSATATAEPVPEPTPVPTPTPTPAPTPTPKGAVKDGWVLSIPEFVPRFAYGELDLEKSKITEAGISTLYDLRFSGVDEGDLDEYCRVLRREGYDAATAKLGSTYTLTAARDLGWNSIALVITLNEGNGVAVYALDAPV